MARATAGNRRILGLIETGDVEGVRYALEHHGHRIFLFDLGDTFEGHSPESEAWLERVRREEER